MMNNEGSGPKRVSLSHSAELREVALLFNEVSETRFNYSQTWACEAPSLVQSEVLCRARRDAWGVKGVTLVNPELHPVVVRRRFHNADGRIS
jgi:hypothetical protein